jgi:release factor glutamine methyltransferase
MAGCAEYIWQKRLVDRVPLQYLTSSAFWRDMVFSVGPGVLIPRPETELIIDYVVEATKLNPSIASGHWADLGTGSGALAVGIARALPLAPTIWAADIASEPLKYTSFNAKRYNVSDRVRVIKSDWFDGLVEAGVEQLCGIVSNPPYIPRTDLQGLQAEVVNHEPHVALDGGGGLAIDSLVPICRGAATLLQPGGFLALETVGGEQAHYIAHILHHLEKSEYDHMSPGDDHCLFEQIAIRRDLRGVERFVTAIKKSH